MTYNPFRRRRTSLDPIPMLPDRDAPEELDIRHLHGVPWYAVAIPPGDHTCWVQSSGWIGLERYVRCGCGAVCRNPCNCCEPNWMDRNRRARDAAPTKENRDAH